MLSFISYIFTWQIDQSFARGSMTEIFANNDIVAQNWLGKLGAKVSHWFFFQFIGVTSFVIAGLVLLFGLRLWIHKLNIDYNKVLGYSFFNIILLSVFFGFVFGHEGFPWGGSFGNSISNYLISFMGFVGTGMTLLFGLFSMLIWLMDPNFDNILSKTQYFFQNAGMLLPKINLSTAGTTSAAGHSAQIENTSKKRKNKPKAQAAEKVEAESAPEEIEIGEVDTEYTVIEEVDYTPKSKKSKKNKKKDKSELEIEVSKVDNAEPNPAIAPPKAFVGVIEAPAFKEIEEEKEARDTPAAISGVVTPTQVETIEGEVPIEVVVPGSELTEGDNQFPLSEESVTITREDYDPRLDLGNFKMPTSDLLEYYGQDKTEIDVAEIEKNKDKIVETLSNYNIGITKISAKIGPTITLYEIVPAKGIRISKIKNLGDDIALSLAALGIRIIAPIPGKGTIGIEVPNKKKEIVSLRSLIESNRFSDNKFELPIAIGTSISRGIHIADLAKMPHLLMAGATGQGKSVGLNDIIISLLYAKHPSEMKFVLIDPKKVELSIYERLEKHYLATLPGSDECILTETKKVVHTLNSLCIEMDERYNLLKMAKVRNVKQYNNKFIKRRLNPEKGHRYLPYIVLVIDEFADLIMTAGKEIETPLTRLAQLSRAIGIHLIIATQRPTTNIITGTIKANFPARIAYKVSSITDSKTILDYKGADQLIGMGDMLLFQNSDIIRMQCAFVDTPEVDRVIESIAEQKGYSEPFMLPEYVDERDGGGALGEGERDEYFEEAAMLVTRAQKGSTSLIQRKLSLGYNRAGRIMDQLEDSGIVGPARGSKPREVMFPDEYALKQFLNPAPEEE